MIKPQFEVGRTYIGKRGIVRDVAHRMRICDDMTAWFAAKYPDWRICGIIESPRIGGVPTSSGKVSENQKDDIVRGNIEFLFAAVCDL